MAVGIRQYDVYWCDLAPAFGHQVTKTRPCAVISPDEINAVVGTVLIAPITTKLRSSPFRQKIIVKDVEGDILYDQIRAIDKRKVKGFVAALKPQDITKLKRILRQLLVD